MKRRLYILSLVLCTLFFALAACGTQSQTSSQSEKEKTVQQEPVKESVTVTEENDSGETASSQKVKEASTEKNDPKQTAAAPAEKKDAAEKTAEKPKASTAKKSEAPAAAPEKKPAPAPAKTAQPKEQVKPKSTAPETKQTPAPPAEKKAAKPAAPPPAEKNEEQLLHIKVTIKGPSDMGTFLKSTGMDVKEGTTVLDALLKVAKDKGIQVDYSGKGALAYVEGINNVYEFDYGPKSGWTCRRNGATLGKSSGVTAVKDGDVIEWIYTEDYSGN